MKKMVVLLFILTLTVAITGVFANTAVMGGETWLIEYKIFWEDTREVVDSGTLRWNEPAGSGSTILEAWACRKLGFKYNYVTDYIHPQEVGNRNQILMFIGVRKVTLVDKFFGRN
jgi:hypothetical protein